MTWWGWALMGALIWGVHYNLIAKAMTSASAITIYFIPNLILMITLPFWYKTLVEDYHSIMRAEWDVKVSVVVIMFTSIIASVAVYKAIHSSNATLASLIEITYPVFVFLFAIVFFKEAHLNTNALIGGGLILAGTGLLIYNS